MFCEEPNTPDPAYLGFFLDHLRIFTPLVRAGNATHQQTFSEPRGGDGLMAREREREKERECEREKE